MKFSDLQKITGGQPIRIAHDAEITNLVLDSRKAIFAPGAVFFAMHGERHDSHTFLQSLYEHGMRQFIVERPVDLSQLAEANVLMVSSSILAMQVIASTHRKQFTLPVIGITGSNGKTIIKEWLYQLLSPEYNIVKNPGSYNSQTGVPLAVWQIQPYHALGIFEAGISKPGEMERLKSIIDPTLGIFTNLGTAHDQGFLNHEHKIKEKLKLFSSVAHLIYCKDQPQVSTLIEQTFEACRLISWGEHPGASIPIQKKGNKLTLVYGTTRISINLPFADAASVENASHCLALMAYLKISPEAIASRVGQLKTVPMRLELKQGIGQCQIIDDTYNNDLAGLQISIDFLSGLQHKKKVIILSDILQSGLSETDLTSKITTLIGNSGAHKFIGIGPAWTRQKDHVKLELDSLFYESTESFLQNVNWNDFHEEAILVKGARPFLFERIIQHLQKKIHGTIMEIDLGAMVDNLNFIKSRLNTGVKLMAMVKAFAYGSGSEEVASLLQYHKVDYLGVAYPDEGIALRKHDIRLPIMVMNPSESSFASMIEHQLEPEIYNRSLLRAFAHFLNGRPCHVHIKLDTGMHRLGFEENELQDAIDILKQNTNIQIASLFTHLAGADDAAHDVFTRGQASRFQKMSDWICRELTIDPIRHILNSSGILRFPDLQLNMVRLGIGLYGINPTTDTVGPLRPVATLKTVISQIKHIKAGQSIGYARSGTATHDMMLATIAIGYADGFSRMFSKGVGAVSIHGQLASVVGNVCMDMTMVDITGIDAVEGDEVIIFGNELPIQQVAQRIKTIPYEILTNTSERVKRVFFAESI